MSSTTHNVLSSLRGLRQIEQTVSSEMLKQRSQYLTSVLSFINVSPKRFTSSFSCLSRKSAKRMAVLFPIPGKEENCSIALAKRFEGYSSKLINSFASKLRREIGKRR